MTEKAFYKITNKMIYDKLENIEKSIIDINGKIKLNRWMAGTALTLVIGSVIGMLIAMVI
jgi:uncharacterized membrane protein